MPAQTHRPQTSAPDRSGGRRPKQNRPDRDWLDGTNYFRVPNALADSGLVASLRAGALRVLTQMLRMLNAAGECWPSQQLLAARCGMDVRTVRRAIDELIAAGLVTRIRKGRSGRATLYRAHPAPAQADTHARRTPRARKAQPVAPKAATHDRSDRAGMSAGSGRACPTNNTQEQDTTLTHRRSRDAAADVCAAFAQGWEAREAARPRNIRDLCGLACGGQAHYSGGPCTTSR